MSADESIGFSIRAIPDSVPACFLVRQEDDNWWTISDAQLIHNAKVFAEVLESGLSNYAPVTEPLTPNEFMGLPISYPAGSIVFFHNSGPKSVSTQSVTSILVQLRDSARKMRAGDTSPQFVMRFFDDSRTITASRRDNEVVLTGPRMEHLGEWTIDSWDCATLQAITRLRTLLDFLPTHVRDVIDTCPPRYWESIRHEGRCQK